MSKAAVGHVGRMRSTITIARGGTSDESESESMRNLAYVVNSANDNINALRATVKQQEKELLERSEQASALQRNYETLSRIRQADQREFLALKADKEAESARVERLQAEVSAERQRNEELTGKLQEVATAHTHLQQLRSQLSDAQRERDEYRKEADQAARQVAEHVESSQALKGNMDKLTRLHQELVGRLRKAEEASKQQQSEKELAEREQHRLGSKLAVQERQLKTFLEANEALENDLREQMQVIASFDRRKQEQEVERQTIEAYYNARLEEMQTQYDRLLAEADVLRQAAKKEQK